MKKQEIKEILLKYEKWMENEFKDSTTYYFMTDDELVDSFIKTLPNDKEDNY
jgi:hypothetical protein